ncbi:MAG TPA: hypothetical protein VJB12_01390, partial [Candidatus Nanoarchaeia archaeon]|nr:hypothetical protein [Candidatus Nanoarchaeia archaeon]
MLNVTANTSASVNINTIVNISANISDETLLANATWVYNYTFGTVINNFTLSGTNAQISNKTILASGGVFNITIFVSDSAGNTKQNSTLITVTDNVAPTFTTATNTTFGVVNASALITEDTGLSNASIVYNISGVITYINFSGLSGTSKNISVQATLESTIGAVAQFNFSATDINGNVGHSAILVTTADTTA